MAPGTDGGALLGCGRRADGHIDLCDEVTGRAEVAIERRRLGHDAAADAMADQTRHVLVEHVAELDREAPT